MMLVGLSLGGCQWLIDVDEPQCESDADCVGLLGRGYTCGNAGVCRTERTPDPGGGQDAGLMLPARWACLADPPEDVTPDPDATVRVVFDVLDHTTLEPPDGLVVKACTPTDVACSNPLRDGVEPDGEGYVEFDLPFGFQGYFELMAPDFVPALSYSNRPALDDEPFPGPNMVTPMALADIAQFGGESIDPERGAIILEAVDCEGNAGDGVRFVRKDESDERPFYFEGALPDRQLDATVVTTALGRGRLPRAVGGFSNVEAGFVTFEAWLVEPEVRMASFAAQIRAGHLTLVRLHAGY